MEAIVNKLGGMKGVERFLAGELIVTESGLALPQKKLIAATAVADIDWALTYSKLGLHKEYAPFEISNLANDSLHWRVPVLRELTHNQIVSAWRSLGVTVYTYTEDLDANIIETTRTPSSGERASYCVSFERSREIKKSMIGISALDLVGQKLDCITLREGMLLQFGYWVTCKKWLHSKTVMQCAGSRHRDGRVPHVSWDPSSRGVCVYWCKTGHRRGNLGTRVAA